MKNEKKKLCVKISFQVFLNMKILLFYLQNVEEHLSSNVMSTIQDIK